MQAAIFAHFQRGQFNATFAARRTANAGGGAVRQTPNQGAKRRVTLAGPCLSCRLRNAKASVMPATRLLRFNRKSVAPCRRPITRPVTTKRISVRVSSLGACPV